MAIPKQTDSSNPNEIILTVDGSDIGLAKNINILQERGRPITELTVAFDSDRHEHSTNNKMLEKIIFGHCKDSLTGITIKNGFENFLGNLCFPNLTHLKYVGKNTDSITPSLFSSNDRIKYLDLLITEDEDNDEYEDDHPNDEAIHQFLFNFKDVRINSDLVLRIYTGSIHEFDLLRESLSLYLKNLRYFEIRFNRNGQVFYVNTKSKELTVLTLDKPVKFPQWCTSIADKITHIVFNGKNWLRSICLCLESFAQNFIGDAHELFLFIDDTFYARGAADMMTRLSKGTKLALYYDINAENASKMFMNKLYFDLKKELTERGVQKWNINFDPNTELSFRAPKIHLKGATITILKNN